MYPGRADPGSQFLQLPDVKSNFEGFFEGDMNIFEK